MQRLILSLLAASTIAHPQILTGPRAAKFFVYKGKPIQPFCIDFPFDSGRTRPKDLADCTANYPAPTGRNNSWQAEASHEDYRESASYEVLAKKGERFLLLTMIWGGGSGHFSNLRWVRLTSSQVLWDKDETGGDRCDGSISRQSIKGHMLHVAQNLTSLAFADLAGVKATGDLNAAPAYCDAEALYQYDIALEKLQLVSVTFFRRSEANPRSDSGAQTCLENLATRFSKKGEIHFTPLELERFGRNFSETCTK